MAAMFVSRAIGERSCRQRTQIICLCCVANIKIYEKLVKKDVVDFLMSHSKANEAEMVGVAIAMLMRESGGKGENVR